MKIGHLQSNNIFNLNYIIFLLLLKRENYYVFLIALEYRYFMQLKWISDF